MEIPAWSLPYMRVRCLVSVSQSMRSEDRTSQLQQDEPVVVGTNLVSVNEIVTEGNGHYVQGLSEDQFRVL